MLGALSRNPSPRSALRSGFREDCDRFLDQRPSSLHAPFGLADFSRENPKARGRRAISCRPARIERSLALGIAGTFGKGPTEATSRTMRNASINASRFIESAIMEAAIMPQATASPWRKTR